MKMVLAGGQVAACYFTPVMLLPQEFWDSALQEQELKQFILVSFIDLCVWGPSLLLLNPSRFVGSESGHDHLGHHCFLVGCMYCFRDSWRWWCCPVSARTKARKVISVKNIHLTLKNPDWLRLRIVYILKTSIFWKLLHICPVWFATVLKYDWKSENYYK